MASSKPAIDPCEQCEGTGWKSVTGGVIRCECVRAARVKFADGVPLEFRDASFDTYRVQVGTKSAVAAAKAFLAGAGDLLLIGPVGCGKTRLACTILNEHHRQAKGGFFVRVPKLMLDLQLSFGPMKSLEDRAEERRYLERLFTTPLLVMDDLGVEKGSEYTVRTLYTVYEERCDRGLRTIWTSNLSLAPDPKERQSATRPPTLGEFLGDDRLPSRMAGRGVVAYLNAADQRLPFTRRGGRDDE